MDLFLQLANKLKSDQTEHSARNKEFDQIGQKIKTAYTTELRAYNDYCSKGIPYNGILCRLDEELEEFLALRIAAMHGMNRIINSSAQKLVDMFPEIELKYQKVIIDADQFINHLETYKEIFLSGDRFVIYQSFEAQHIKQLILKHTSNKDYRLRRLFKND